MRTITTETKVFTFDELSEKAKEVARHHAREIELSDEWWANVYEAAATIGLKLEGFDLDRGREIHGELTEHVGPCITLIHANHGKDCDTYKLADKYQARLTAAVLGETDDWQELRESGNASDFADGFRRELLECYWHMLDRERDYLRSDEYVDERLRDDREFEVDGTRQGIDIDLQVIDGHVRVLGPE